MIDQQQFQAVVDEVGKKEFPQIVQFWEAVAATTWAQTQKLSPVTLHRLADKLGIQPSVKPSPPKEPVKEVKVYDGPGPMRKKCECGLIVHARVLVCRCGREFNTKAVTPKPTIPVEKTPVKKEVKPVPLASIIVSGKPPKDEGQPVRELLMEVSEMGCFFHYVNIEEKKLYRVIRPLTKEEEEELGLQNVSRGKIMVNRVKTNVPGVGRYSGDWVVWEEAIEREKNGET